MADNAVLLAAGDALARLVSAPTRWERFVWTVTPRPTLNAHPALCRPRTWQPAMPTAVAAQAWWRTERQTFIPVPDAGAGGVHHPGRHPAAGPGHRQRRQGTAAARCHRLDEPGRAAVPQPQRRARRPCSTGWRAALRPDATAAARQVACCSSASAWARPSCKPGTTGRSDPARATRLDFIALTPTPPTCRGPAPGAPRRRAAAAGRGIGDAVAAADAQPAPPELRGRRACICCWAWASRCDLLPELQAQVQRLPDRRVRRCRPTRSGHRCACARAWHGWRHRGPSCAQRRAAGAAAGPGQRRLRSAAGTTEIARRLPPALRAAAARPASTPATERHALIVGAGLAGCATAWALAEQGWRSTVIDRADAPATEGSGNPAGLFHGIVNPQDGAHARFNRAAALLAQRTVQHSHRRRHGPRQRARPAAAGHARPGRRRRCATSWPRCSCRRLRAGTRCGAGQRALRPAAAAPGLVLPRRRLGAAGGAGALVPAAGRRLGRHSAAA